MSAYSDAVKIKGLLRQLIKEEIENNETIKSIIKAKKAIVTEVANTETKTVKVKLMLDIFNVSSEPLTLPYNSRMETYLTTEDAVGKTVSVWFYQSINNGIVMQSGDWTI